MQVRASLTPAKMAEVSRGFPLFRQANSAIVTSMETATFTLLFHEIVLIEGRHPSDVSAKFSTTHYEITIE